MTRILMVCLGNICRSPLAHGIMASKLPDNAFFVDSAGTGNYHIGSAPDQRSIDVAKRHGIEISEQTCRQFTVADYDNFDHIYVMDASNLSDVLKMARNSDDKNKVSLLVDVLDLSINEVPDPYHGTTKDFKMVYDILENACDVLSERFKNS